MTTPDLAGLCERLRQREKLVRFPGPSVFEGDPINPDGPEAAAAIESLVAALESVRDMTDPDNPESYRCDDREGCLDAVHHTARTALQGASDAS